MKHKIFLAIGVFILGLFTLFAIFPQLFAPYLPKDLFTPWQSPNAMHILGTNDIGFDIFTEIVYATKNTLLIGITSALISLVLGTAIGILAGYSNGFVGDFFDGLIQIVIMIPMLPLAIVVAALVGASPINIILVIALLGWGQSAKAIRAKTIELKQSSFVESLVILDISSNQIMRKHIFPNLLDVVLAKYIMSVASCIMLESTLSFIGLGSTVNVTWGTMINLAYQRGGFVRGAYNWLFTPGICITLCILAFYFINFYFDHKLESVSNMENDSPTPNI